MADDFSPDIGRSDPPSQPPVSPWGFWATMGFSVVIGLAALVVQILVMVAVVIAKAVRNPALNIEQYARTLGTDGFLLALAVCVSAPCCLGLVVLFVKLRRGMNHRSYLALNPTPWHTFVVWIGILILFAVSSDLLSLLLGRPIVPEVITSTYRNTSCRPLLWFALVVVAPLWEEVFFRGFMFRGILCSRAGAVGAILLTALTWSVVHVQYDAYGIVTIFAGGLLLGIARLRTDSLYVTILMHSTMNLIATAEAAWIAA